MNEDRATRPATERTIVGRRADENEVDEVVVADNMPVEPVVDVEEWQADEAGYGYGV